MGKVLRVLRRSFNAFSYSYQAFTSTAFLMISPVSAAVLLSQSLLPANSSSMKILSARMRLLFDSAGFPAYSEFFTLLNIKLCQSIFSFIFTLPFTLTFLLLAKSTVLQTLHKQHRRSKFHLYSSLLLTQIFNSFFLLSANAAVFSVLFVAFNIADLLEITSSSSILALSAAGAIIYSLVLANATVICNMATIISVVENCGGYIAVLKACFLLRGEEATAMTLALPANLGFAAIEALFQYRIVKPYHISSKLNIAVISEGFSLTYMHSLMIVLDIIINYMFYNSCRLVYECKRELEQEDKDSLEA